MRASIIAGLIAFIMTSCQQKMETKHPGGQLYESYTVDDDGNKHGEYKRYLEDGSLAETTNFVHGLQDGKRTLYYQNGNVESESDYVDGKLHGKHLVYHPTGELMIESTYENSTIVGVLKKYYTNGKLQEEVTFADDMENGPFKEYYENGQVKWQGQYLNGEHEFGIIEHFDENGELLKRIECDSMKLCKTLWEKEEAVKS